MASRTHHHRPPIIQIQVRICRISLLPPFPRICNKTCRCLRKLPSSKCATCPPAGRLSRTFGTCPLWTSPALRFKGPQGSPGSFVGALGTPWTYWGNQGSGYDMPANKQTETGNQGLMMRRPYQVLEGIILGTTIGVIKGDSRSLDFSSYRHDFAKNPYYPMAQYSRSLQNPTTQNSSDMP